MDSSGPACHVALPHPHDVGAAAVRDVSGGPPPVREGRRGHARHVRAVRDANVPGQHGEDGEGLHPWYPRENGGRPLHGAGRVPAGGHLQHPAGAPLLPQHDPPDLDPDVPARRAEAGEPVDEVAHCHALGALPLSAQEAGREQSRDRRADLPPEGRDLPDHVGAALHGSRPAVARLPMAHGHDRPGRNVPQRARPRVCARPAGAPVRGPGAAPAPDSHDEHADPAHELPRQGVRPLPLLLRRLHVGGGGHRLRPPVHLRPAASPSGLQVGRAGRVRRAVA
mmetsp:Transcript_77444/g.203304  ORF Transcript_77444/g.203304 Transcript_77444/m.203304 type:complete len:281 (-) Transcript_77444:139-981(-)